MRKLITILTLVGIFGMGGLALAQEKVPECCKLRMDFKDIDPNCTAGSWVGPASCGPDPGDPCYCPSKVTTGITNSWGLCCLFNTVYTTANWIMALLITSSVLIGVWGGWNIVISGGDPQKVDKGKNWILFGIVGIIVGIVARSLPAFVRLLIR